MQYILKRLERDDSPTLSTMTEEWTEKWATTTFTCAKFFPSRALAVKYCQALELIIAGVHPPHHVPNRRRYIIGRKRDNYCGISASSEPADRMVGYYCAPPYCCSDPSLCAADSESRDGRWMYKRWVYMRREGEKRPPHKFRAAV